MRIRRILLLVSILIFSASVVLAIAPARFHHVHLNVKDRDKSIKFYEKFFGATEVNYRGRSRALFTERSFLLLDQVKNAPQTNDGTTIWHIGWAGVDGQSEYKWRVDEGIDVQLPVTRPVLPGIDNKAEYMYFHGPDKELVEVSTAGRHHRFDHVHLLSSDVNATTAWFQTHLGLKPGNPKAIDFYGIVMNTIQADNVNIVIFGRPVPDRGNQFAAKTLWPQTGFRPTENTAIDHLAFSYSSINPILSRMRSARANIIRGLKADSTHGHKSFFVRGPDNLLIEIVEDRPIPEGLWAR